MAHALNLNLDSRQKETLRQKGYRALARAQLKSGEKRISKASLAPEVLKLDAEGYNNLQIAWALQRGDRYIREVRKWGNESGTNLIYINRNPVLRDDLPEELRPLVEFTADAFELFFNKYSGRILPIHCKFWVDSWINSRNLMINVPPGHAKSTVMAVWIPIWLLSRDRDVQIILISAGKDLMLIHTNEIASHLENNLDLIRDFGRFKPDQRGDAPWRPNQGELIVAGRHREYKSGQLSLQVRGSGQHVLGMRADFVIIDDPTNSEIAVSPTENKKQVTWLQQNVLTRIEPQEDLDYGGKALIIGQRVHIRDLYGQIEKQKYEQGPLRGQPYWKVEKTPAVIRWPGEDPENPAPLVLWPERWSFEELMVVYERIGGKHPFACLFQQKPHPEGGGIVEEDWKVKCVDPERKGLEGFQGEDKAAQGLPIVRVIGVDPTPTQSAGIVVGDLLYDREVFTFAVIEVIRLEAGVRKLKYEIDRCIQQYRPDYMVFEQSGFSVWLEEDPIYEAWRKQVRIINHHTGVNKNSMEYGVQSLAGDFEFGHIRLPGGDDSGRYMTDMLWEELELYPSGDTWDLVMALWFIKYNYKSLVPVFAYNDTFDRVGGSRTWSFVKKQSTVGDMNQARVDEFREMMRKAR